MGWQLKLRSFAGANESAAEEFESYGMAEPAALRKAL